jgi:hypothetical protein
VCDHPDVAKCLFFKTTRFHPKNEVSISSSWDVGEGISFCDEEVGAGGLVGDFGVRRGAYKQSENMSPPNSQTTREKVREKEDVELGEVCLQNMYRVCGGLRHPCFQPGCSLTFLNSGLRSLVPFLTVRCFHVVQRMTCGIQIIRQIAYRTNEYRAILRGDAFLCDLRGRLTEISMRPRADQA